MAHFAELDENNYVKRVVVVDDRDTSDANGVEKEHIGKAHLEKILGGNWIQCSYNNKIRRRYPAEGYFYDSNLDIFVPPSPFPSWTEKDESGEWQPPASAGSKPADTEEVFYYWDENTVSWKSAARPSSP